jgi:hypothetical protein
MEEEYYREPLHSVSLTDSNEPLIEQEKCNFGYYVYKLFCKKPIKYVIKFTKKLFSCFSQHSNKQI